MPILDGNDEDTLWVDCLYSMSDRDELVLNLKRLYSILHADGSDTILPFITVDSIAFCTFGNTKPFREGSECHQRQLHFPVHQEMRRFPHLRVGIGATSVAEPHQFLGLPNTLIEEHIVGIPGDVFIDQRLDSLSMQDKRALAKEYIKFNERCFLRLLGDMRSYNYVVVITQDFDRIQYRLRAIDFDQQSYEGTRGSTSRNAFPRTTC